MFWSRADARTHSDERERERERPRKPNVASGPFSAPITEERRTTEDSPDGRDYTSGHRPPLPTSSELEGHRNAAPSQSQRSPLLAGQWQGAKILGSQLANGKEAWSYLRPYYRHFRLENNSPWPPGQKKHSPRPKGQEMMDCSRDVLL